MKNKGFTLPELILVVSLVAVLFTLVLILLDPPRLFAESRNTRRWHDVNNLTTAVYRYIVQTSSVPEEITQQEQQIGTAQSGCNQVCTNAQNKCVDISKILLPYLVEIPVDPKGGTQERTYFSIIKNQDGAITIKACNAERGEDIRISR